MSSSLGICSHRHCRPPSKTVSMRAPNLKSNAAPSAAGSLRSGARLRWAEPRRGDEELGRGSRRSWCAQARGLAHAHARAGALRRAASPMHTLAHMQAAMEAACGETMEVEDESDAEVAAASARAACAAAAAMAGAAATADTATAMRAQRGAEAAWSAGAGGMGATAASGAAAAGAASAAAKLAGARVRASLEEVG
eukprot:7388004-Prymnesium_polylepis.1